MIFQWQANHEAHNRKIEAQDVRYEDAKTAAVILAIALKQCPKVLYVERKQNSPIDPALQQYLSSGHGTVSSARSSFDLRNRHARHIRHPQPDGYYAFSS